VRKLAVGRLRVALGALDGHRAEAIERGIKVASPRARGYKAQVRAVVHILATDKRQPGCLLQRLRDGSVLAERVGTLRPDQMPCDADREHAAALRDGSHTAARELLRNAPEGCHKCPRCGDSRTVHTCAQTRCGDEPMTVFVTCLCCDNHFRG
jgi:DNA-directed RNA polymerase subunit M/transcription elongation factor TFIIS